MKPLKLAVMPGVPTLTPVARPVLALTLAVASLELHTADDVTSFVLLSTKLAVALNCSVWPMVTLAGVGDTVIPTSAGGKVRLLLPGHQIRLNLGERDHLAIGHGLDYNVGGGCRSIHGDRKRGLTVDCHHLRGLQWLSARGIQKADGHAGRVGGQRHSGTAGRGGEVQAGRHGPRR